MTVPGRRRLRTKTPAPAVNPQPVAPLVARVPSMGARRRLRSKQPPPDACQNPSHSDAGRRLQEEEHHLLTLSKGVQILISSALSRPDGIASHPSSPAP